MKVPIHLPLFQKFDCHSCGHCCRGRVVNVTRRERQKIIDAGWEPRMGGRPLFIRYRFRWRRLHRLAHQPDESCIFLDDQNRCRLHAESGVEIKPLTCRLYPFVPTPGAGSVRVDLRADCPSVAANRGRSLNVHRGAIIELADETGTGAWFSRAEWPGGRQLSNEEFEALVQAFDSLLANARLCHRDRLRAGAKLLDLLYAARIRTLKDDRFVELLHLLGRAVVEEAIDDAGSPPVPMRGGRLFRQWLFLHTLADDPSDLALRGFQRYRRSWQRYRQARRFAEGTGPLPRVRPEWPETTFEQVAAVEGCEDVHLEPLIRSMQVKLDAHAFCGPGYYGVDAIRGLTALWLLPAVAGWLARLSAVQNGAGRMTRDDLVTGLRQAHFTFAVSPVFTRVSERLRLHAFARPGVPAALLGAYGP